MAGVQGLGNGKSLTCHAWNGDGSRVAICPNTNEVQIFYKDGTEWKLEHTLAQHDSLVTGIDWAPKKNRIVTCSQDRNAYVWQLQDGTWKPELVILRINRAATDVKWSPNEDKFAVASSAKVVSVCHFEEDNDWWVSKHIKKHRSTVLKVAWHPNNNILATACTDYKARVFSAAIKGVDKKPEPTVWGEPKIFGDLLGEFDCTAWVHGITFSTSGNILAYSGHDSTVSFVDPQAGNNATTIRLSGLPLLDLLFLDDTRLVGAGHDCMPFLFTNAGGWSFTKSFDGEKKEAPKAGEAGAGARAMFQNMDSRGTTDSSSLQTVLDTKHQNTITCLRPYKKMSGKTTEFTSSGLDGNVVFWKA